MASAPTLAAFIAELRAVGLPVSVAEHADAMAAVLAMPLTGRAALKTTLAATLVKNADHYRAFDVVFDIFFSDKRIGPEDLAGSPEDPSRDGAPAAGEGDGEGGGGGGGGGSGDPGVIAALGDDDLSDLVSRAAVAGDRLLLRAALAEAVTRYADFEPGRRVAGVYYLSQTMRGLGLDGRLEPAQIEGVRTQAEAEIRRRLIADRGAEAVASTLRAPLPEDADLLSISPEQLAETRQAVAVLGRKLASRLARKRRHHQRSALDFRRTIRASLANGGVPADLYFRKPRPAKPEIMLLVDVSSSVSTFAAFTLQLAYTIRSQFSKVRTFAFTDGIEEITAILENAADVPEAARHINGAHGFVRLDGHSDYGMALTRFWDRWGPEVTSRTSVIILGDARNNYHASRAGVLDAVREQARHLYWLNPEQARAWDTGDSIAAEYGQHCDRMTECRNLRQLKEFAEALD
ncbi:MAG: VWA domain-containing protein [Streptosporangiales bacterium]|nr:VWA domain-containing protein [Streptosporangiales bacterium]